jgi:hypothetical protein
MLFGKYRTPESTARCLCPSLLHLFASMQIVFALPPSLIYTIVFSNLSFWFAILKIQLIIIQGPTAKSDGFYFSANLKTSGFCIGYCHYLYFIINVNINPVAEVVN